jgi:hypothetical protein
MNGRTFGVDRLIAILLGLALLLGGAWLVAWSQGWLPQGWWSPSRFRLGLDGGIAEAEWWPWALLLGGILLFMIGLAWFLQHFRHSTVDTLSLPGDPRGGRLLVDGDALASGVASALEEGSEAITSAKGKVVDQKGTLVLDMTTSIRRDADLREVGRLCDEVAAQARRAVGRSDLACRVRVKVAPRAKRSPRVH